MTSIVQFSEFLIRRFPRPLWAVLAVFYAGLLLYAGGRPGSDLALPSRLPPGSDKILHFLAFAALGALIFRAVYDPDPRVRPRPRWGVWLVVLVPLLVGLTDEIHQLFVPGRMGDPADLVADTLGGMFVLVFGLTHRSLVKRRLRAR